MKQIKTDKIKKEKNDLPPRHKGTKKIKMKKRMERR